MGDYRRNDIKAPDGYLLGGLRRVRKDGTILFQRGWWKAPDEWIGKEVWVHCYSDVFDAIEAAPPGQHIYDAQLAIKTYRLPRTDREDAKLGWRNPIHVAWANRNKTHQPNSADTQIKDPDD